MELHEVLVQLEEAGDASTRKIYLNNGAKEPLFGVKMGDVRKLAKKIKTDQCLADELYDTGILDAMMLAGMIADSGKMSVDQLGRWVEKAYCAMVSERCVAPLAAQNPQRFEIAANWIESPHEQTACAGFTVYGMLYSHIPDDRLDLDQVKSVVDTIERRIQSEPTYLQNAMNNCLIMIGIYVLPLTSYCLEVSRRIGYVKPTVKINSCNIQSATDYIVRYAPRTKVKSL
ncbi:MAG: hypothetical protein A2Y20_06250 [Firmicutes bacterium GWF2_51_9]|nr:DNA alkylation repair protein [Erysipelotrichaceae bacterium]OGS54564.1 MAG: hypothetical protein A2Y20_06250 [Firmicutes bacterium GWF2_51_9]OGS59534.1 MAG: hypothetical protein A2Y19_11160 [Firmicutes bacterium GWE2_51_13]